MGESICGIRNLRCAHFFLIGEGLYDYRRWVSYSDIRRSGYHIRLGSYDFRDTEKYEYFKICDHGIRNTHHYLDEILDMAPTEENQAELLDEIEELFALDTFMGQTDRIWSNVLFERDKETREIHLAPIYDFEYSLKRCYLDPNKVYDNILLPFYSGEDYLEFIKEHPEFVGKLKSYLDVDLVGTIQKSYADKRLCVPESKLPFYQDFEHDRKEFIKSIIK